MSRYYLPEKENEGTKEIKKHDFSQSKKIKDKKKQGSSSDGEYFDPYHGPAPIPKSVLEKYQRGKRLDVVSILICSNLNVYYITGCSLYVFMCVIQLNKLNNNVKIFY